MTTSTDQSHDLSKPVSKSLLLQENPDRFVVFPVKYPDLYAFYKRHQQAFWPMEEVDLSKDISDWKSLDNHERHFIVYVLSFFAASDGIVLENLGKQFLSEVQIPEARLFYGFQMMMEGVHMEMYGRLIETYVTDPVEQAKTFHAIENFESVRLKAEWALKYINNTDSFARRLLAFAIVEGVFFSSSFCAIFWVRKRGKMPGLCFSNDLIARDEGLHCEFAVHEYKNYIPDDEKLTEVQAHEIYRDAVEIEHKFVDEALPNELVGINAVTMKQYVEYIADFWLVNLGYSKLYNSENPFPWMESINLAGMTNFFEKRNGEYRKSTKKRVFSLDADI